MQLRKYRLLNKQNHISSNFFVIIIVVCMHYKVSEDDFTLQSFLNLQTFLVFQGWYSGPIFKHTFWFLLAETYLYTSLEK